MPGKFQSVYLVLGCEFSSVIACIPIFSSQLSPAVDKCKKYSIFIINKGMELFLFERECSSNLGVIR